MAIRSKAAQGRYKIKNEISASYNDPSNLKRSRKKNARTQKWQVHVTTAVKTQRNEGHEKANF